ncbi:MAG TPA: type II toxin-antitoxin system HigB family toxin [Tepidisphaeraceae bacterium]|nr:type II toxin-antitoxin system HigB family toxin [Tepidisphaeraceae bacterium]
MAFTVLNTIALDRFARKHRDAKKVLADWLDTVKRAQWQNLNDLQRVYPSADGVNVRVGGGQVVVVTVFNIKGNEYRLIAAIHYATSVCRVVEMLTHAEYSTNRWKDRL